MRSTLIPEWRMSYLFLPFFFILSVASVFPLLQARDAAPGIIPRPLRVSMQPGRFRFTPYTVIGAPVKHRDWVNLGRYLAAGVERITGWKPPVEISGKANEGILLLPAETMNWELGEKGYVMDINRRRIELHAVSPAGAFHAIQSLLQIMAAAEKIREKSIMLPSVYIEDTPRFAWRGAMLDVSRHFFPKEFIKRFIDFLAFYKLNTFHWHLTDDQGWRIEIRKYPRLTQVGAWRVDREDRPWEQREPQKEGEIPTYGGFYSQEEIREIVEYARNRFVTIVPEIEMPAHSVAALAAYPGFSCTGGPFTVLPGGYWPNADIYCAGKEETFRFLEDVLSEVIDLFPGEFIHIGGDEADKSRWKACPACQERMRKENMRDESELQSYFVRRIGRFLASRGRRLIGWDEIIEGGLAPGAAVMSWRGFEGGVAAARAGHRVVMCPTSHCYFDYCQGERESEPEAFGGYLPLRKVYSFEPVPEELTPEEAADISGVQANLWSEFIPDGTHAEYMLFPRLAALAETSWTLADRKDWPFFLKSLESHYRMYDRFGWNYARSAHAVYFEAGLPRAKGLSVSMKTSSHRPQIRYTLDGTLPTPGSRLFRKPIVIRKKTVIRAAAFRNGEALYPPSQREFNSHRAAGKKITLTFPFSPKYRGGNPMGLVDGRRASSDLADDAWQGYEQSDLDAVIDLGKRMPLTRISVSFLQNQNSWIFLPRRIEFTVSDDGKEFRMIKTIENDASREDPEVRIGTYKCPLDGIQARYIRVRAVNVGICPDWHRGAGGKAWLFADEIEAD